MAPSSSWNRSMVTPCWRRHGYTRAALSSHLQADPGAVFVCGTNGCRVPETNGQGQSSLAPGGRQGQTALLLMLLSSGHCVGLRQPAPSVEGCMWLEPVTVPVFWLSFVPVLPYPLCSSPICRPGPFVLEETRRKRSRPPGWLQLPMSPVQGCELRRSGVPRLSHFPTKTSICWGPWCVLALPSHRARTVLNFSGVGVVRSNLCAGPKCVCLRGPNTVMGTGFSPCPDSLSLSLSLIGW